MSKGIDSALSNDRLFNDNIDDTGIRRNVELDSCFSVRDGVESLEPPEDEMHCGAIGTGYLTKCRLIGFLHDKFNRRQIPVQTRGSDRTSQTTEFTKF
jgi:hypothetical protein